ncbi:MAG: hypothetical protein ACKVS6_17005 [Planctomycetota bacterium]
MKSIFTGFGLLFLMIGPPIMYAQEPGPKPKPVCPKEKATSTATSQTTGATTTCTDGSACGYTVTVTNTAWSCAKVEEETKCVTDSNAAQVQVFKYDCVPIAGTYPVQTTCGQASVSTLTTMVGKKTVGC